MPRKNKLNIVPRFSFCRKFRVWGTHAGKRIMQILRLVNYLFSILFISVAVSCGEPGQQPDPAEASALASSSRLRVLAIGNSFTDNATLYIPEILSTLATGDDVFFAKTVLGNSTLQQHWENYQSGAEVYGMSYACGGAWQPMGNRSLEYAMDFADWDVVVVQQVSWLAGVSASYYPWLENIADCLRVKDPDIVIGWQMTWAYAPYSSHAEFYRYGNKYNRMLEDIAEATDAARGVADFVIPSGLMIDRLRGCAADSRIYAPDGFHLSDGVACYALSGLWHETVIVPRYDSCLDRESYLGAAALCGVGDDDAAYAYELILQLIQ